MFRDGGFIPSQVTQPGVSFTGERRAALDRKIHFVYHGQWGQLFKPPATLSGQQFTAFHHYFAPTAGRKRCGQARPHLLFPEHGVAPRGLDHSQVRLA